jgi:hypothetical protein
MGESVVERMAGWIVGLNQFTINSSQDGGKQ